MPALQQQSADVRFREIDLSQVIRSNASSNAAQVFASKKGRLTRFRSTSTTQFNNEYGEPDAKVSFAHYTANDFFREGASLLSVRVCGSGHRTAAVLLKDNGAGITSLQAITAGIPDIENIDWDTLVSGSDRPLALFFPKSGPGSYAHGISLGLVSQNVSLPAAPDLTTSNLGGTLAAATYSYRVSAISETGETLASASSSAVISSSGSTNSVTVSWPAVASARGYYVYGRVNGNMFRIATLGASTTTFLDVGTATPDTEFPPITNPANVASPTDEFTVNVYDTTINGSVPQESFLVTLSDKTNDQGAQMELEQMLNPYSDLIGVANNLGNLGITAPAVRAAAKVAMTGGDSGAAPTNGQIAQAWIDNFGDPELSNVNILINGGYTDVVVHKTLIRVAEQRGDAFAILDAPSSMQKTEDVIAYRQLILNANSSYGALYTSDVYENDNLSGKRLYVPPSGWMAAVFARTDRLAGPQFAPAGLTRGLIDVLDLRHKYGAQDRTDLFLAQVNYVRNFTGGEGNAVFEQVTLQAKQSALSWINVRRMVNVIKASVRDFLMYSVHEPNDPFTRKQIVRACTDYLQAWKDARGVSDFLVVSDDSNNPAAQYNLGILKVTIFITPIIAVHEIQVDMVITKAGLAYSEISIANLG